MATETLRPDNPGDECNITIATIACPNHYQNVDEVVADGISTIVREEAEPYTEFRRDLYNIESPSVGSGIINHITVYARGYRGNQNQECVKICVKTNGVAHEGSAFYLNVSWTDHSEQWILNPETGEEWTWDEVSALQIGVAMRSATSDDSSYAIITQVWVIVDYTEVPPPSFPSDWDYKKEVTLVEQSGGAYPDYPTIITVAYNAHMKTDFADCRFTESDGTTLIPYGIVEKTDGVSCTFVIKRNYTSGCSLTVYLYYGSTYAADASVDHGPWALAWYLANGFGQNPSAYSNTNCTLYPHSATDDIPAWADVAFGGCRANGNYRAYYGRAKINGTIVPWASTVVCGGRGDFKEGKWLIHGCTIQLYNHAAFLIGESNTVTWGHYHGPNPGFWVSYYPTDPSVSFGGEETSGIVETIVAQRFPMHYLSKPAKAQELISKVEGATIMHTAKDFPENLLKKGKAQELRSKWV